MTLLRNLVAALLVLSGSFVAAQTAGAAAGPSMALVSQDLVIAPGAGASFTFTVAGTVPDDTEVVVEAYTRLTNAREDLRLMLAGEVRYRDVGFVATSLDLLTPDGLGRYTVNLPTVVTAQERVQGGNALLPDPGMYPVTVELRASNEPLAHLATAIVRTADANEPAPLDVALVVPISSAPTLRADGTTIIDPADRTRLQTLTSVLAGTTTPLTVQARPELVDGLARTGLPADGELRAALASAIGSRQVLATPYVDMDPTAAVRSGLSGELTKQLTQGEDATASALRGVSTDRMTWVASQRVGADGLQLLRGLGVRHVVVPADALTDPTSAAATTAASTTVVEVGTNAPMQVAAADAGLAAAFDAHDDPVLAAYQLMAELLAISIDHPPVSGRQGVVIVPPAGWQPDPTFLGTAVTLLGQNPLLHAVTLDEWFREVAVTADPPRALADAEPGDLTSFATGLTLTRLRLAGLASMLPATDVLPASLDARLRVANASSLDTEQRQAYLDATNEELNQLEAAVDPVPVRRITLASRATEIPITLHRRIDRPIKVRIHLESPKLSFPENDILVTIDGETVQQRVAVQARANGTFPLTVRITTPDGDIAVAPVTELTVQATTLSGFGVVATVGALLVLATWWVRHLRRNRRRRSMVATARHHPSAGTTASA